MSISEKLNEIENLHDLLKSGHINEQEYQNLKSSIIQQIIGNYPIKNVKSSGLNIPKSVAKPTNSILSIIIISIVVIISILLGFYLQDAKISESINIEKEPIYDNSFAIKLIDSVLFDIYKHDYYDANGEYPENICFSYDTLYTFDFDKNNYQDILVKYWCEDFIYGNTPYIDWLLILFFPDKSYNIHMPKLDNYFSLLRIDQDTLVFEKEIYDSFSWELLYIEQYYYIFANTTFLLVKKNKL